MATEIFSDPLREASRQAVHSLHYLWRHLATNYERGRAFEYKRRDFYLKEKAFLMVLRTAGSHGPYDLVGIGPSGGVHLIQCKRCKTKAEAERLIKAFKTSPPLVPKFRSGFVQLIDVYVEDTREVLTGFV